jgi:hypothetical protein
LSFFNENSNCERCVLVIIGQFFPQLTEEERLYGWFPQDSATAHAARMSTQALSDVFGGRIISSDIWPARSPDLNPCDVSPGVVRRTKFRRVTPIIFIGKLQIFLQNSFKG